MTGYGSDKRAISVTGNSGFHQFIHSFENQKEMIIMNQRKRSSIRSLLAALALGAAMVLALLPATSASAYTAQNSGRPGGIYVTKVQGLHYNACAGTLMTCYNPDVNVPAPYVYRSPALAGNQTVFHMTTLYRWSGSAWVVIATRSELRTLAAGTPGGYVRAENFTLSKAGYYKVGVGFTWLNPTRTHNYGTRVIDFNQAGDYQCVGRFTASCNAQNGYVYLRSPGL